MPRHADLGPLEDFDRDALLEYVRSLLWQFRLVDAFWFLTVEERFGLPAAEAVNEDVWGIVGTLGARDIMERFGETRGIDAGGLDGFARALSLFPWSRLVGYELTRPDEGSMELTVQACPAQEGRRAHGLEPYVCKHMHMAEFKAFAAEIDPRIRVECRFAPPDPEAAKPAGYESHDCAWRFSLAPEPDAGSSE
jgi:hypothetical protein